MCSGRCLLFSLGRFALGLRHLFEALALAGVLTFARVLGRGTGRLTLARVHAIAVDLGFLGARGVSRNAVEQQRGGGCDGGALNLTRVFHVHFP